MFTIINPSALHNEIMSNILDRLPNGHSLLTQMNSRQRGLSTVADTSQEVTSSAGNLRGLTSSLPNNISAVPFHAILDYISEGGQADAQLREAIELEIEAAALRHNLDPSLIRAVIRVESSYRHDAVSHAGAMGLMQLMPGTAASLGVVDPFDIRQNIDGGTRYLRQLLDMFDNDLTLALAAYNAGQGAVRRHGGIPPFRETQNFVPRVKGYMENYALAQYRISVEDSKM
ncbi:MAG: lytic transglycosylase domain-containing protein [Defluviitaleaceae bacterium]|nr:lytic transglycosylase domain-containing protein [Defluviitaleaceae bacterium]